MQKGNILVYLLVAVLVVAGVIAGAFYLNNQNSSNEPLNTLATPPRN